MTLDFSSKVQILALIFGIDLAQPLMYPPYLLVHPVVSILNVPGEVILEHK